MGGCVVPAWCAELVRRARVRQLLLVIATLAVASLAVGCGSGAQSGGDGACDPNYEGACVPISYDLNCADIGAMVQVVGDDPNGFDADGDGYGCESYG